MLMRVPNYRNVTVNGALTGSPIPWMGTKNGVVAFRVNETLNGSGVISVSALGYPTGTGYAGTYVSSAYGGGTTGEGTYGGYGNGAGGGYGTGGQSSGNSAGGSDYGRKELDLLFPGGGGGLGGNCTSSSCQDHVAGSGGTGGGILWIGANTINFSGTIASNGSDGGDGSHAGTGGAAAGGSIRIEGSSITLGTVSAAGGTYYADGGLGRIAIYYANSLSNSTTLCAQASTYCKNGTLAAATLVAPKGSTGTGNPTYTWNTVAGATYYYLWVGGPSGNAIQQWYTSAQANCNANTCSVAPAITLASGAYTWWVQTWNPGGYGPWSSGMEFNISSNIPAPVSVPQAGWQETDYHYDGAQPHAVTSLDKEQSPAGTYGYEYDANGNMTCRVEDGVTYRQNYNAENRISSISVINDTNCDNLGAEIVETWMYVYDGDGIRVSTAHTTGLNAIPDSLSTYFMGGAYEITNGVVRKYYSLGGQTIMRDADGLKYFLNDHLGSVSVVLSPDGDDPDTEIDVEQQRYLPFGGVRTDLATSPRITSTDFTYTGQRNLPGTGLMDYKARFYSPSLGRFIQPDSIIPNPTNPQSFNRFSYVINNPLQYTDPTGHKYNDCEGLDDVKCKRRMRHLNKVMAGQKWGIDWQEYNAMMKAAKMGDMVAYKHNNFTYYAVFGQDGYDGSDKPLLLYDRTRNKTLKWLDLKDSFMGFYQYDKQSNTLKLNPWAGENPEGAEKEIGDTLTYTDIGMKPSFSIFSNRTDIFIFGQTEYKCNGLCKLMQAGGLLDVVLRAPTPPSVLIFVAFQLFGRAAGTQRGDPLVVVLSPKPVSIDPTNPEDWFPGIEQAFPKP